MTPETTLYLLAALIILYMYMVRKKGLDQVGPDAFPELEKPIFFEFKRLLDDAYERMLYLVGAFVVLAIASYFGVHPRAKLVFFALLAVAFISNIPPRNRIFRFLEAFNLDPKTLKKRGIRL